MKTNQSDSNTIWKTQTNSFFQYIILWKIPYWCICNAYELNALKKQIFALFLAHNFFFLLAQLNNSLYVNSLYVCTEKKIGLFLIWLCKYWFVLSMFHVFVTLFAIVIDSDDYSNSIKLFSVVFNFFTFSMEF